MSNFKAILLLIILSAAVSCNSYELMRYKGGAVDKVENAEKHKIYICADKKVYKVTKPSITTAGLSGNIEQIKNEKDAQEIKNPSPAQLKRHKHDLDIVTKTEIPDSIFTIALHKTAITGYNLIVSHSKINWKKIGEIIEAIFGIALCLVLLGALIYWFTFI